MSLSIRTRVFRLTFFANVLFSVLLLSFSWWALEDLEESVLMSDLTAESHYFHENGDKTLPLKVITSQITAAFIPRGHAGTDLLPVLFNNLPVPFQGEIEFLDSDYFVITKALPEGNYYLAKALTLYDERETKLTMYTLAFSLLLIVCCFSIATVFSRRISAPTVILERQIQNLEHNNLDARLSTQYVDRELNEIAAAINALLDQVQQATKRERSLIGMASHELRTPISVVLGAARVLEKRNNLNKQDHTTLTRIINASEDMSNNVRALLAVVKQAPENLVIEAFDLAHLIQELEQTYHLEQTENGDELATTQRLHLQAPDTPVVIRADRALVRMMLHNLISNALNHTQGNVTILLDTNGIQIQDQGDVLQGQPLALPTEFRPSSGLGLYIVTLICEKLKWKLHLDAKASGQVISISF